MAIPSVCLLAFSLRDKLASMSWLELVLWFGLAGLTGALLVLMGTRWGQVRPVSKCVVLSVFAHLLFLCYAYGTRLNLENGSLLGSGNVRVTFLDSGESLPTFPPIVTQAAETFASRNSQPVELPEDGIIDLAPVDPPPAPAALPEPQEADASPLPEPAVPDRSEPGAWEPPPAASQSPEPSPAEPDAPASRVTQGAPEEAADGPPAGGVPPAEPQADVPPQFPAPQAEVPVKEFPPGPDTTATVEASPAAPPGDIDIELPQVPDDIAALRPDTRTAAESATVSPQEPAATVADAAAAPPPAETEAASPPTAATVATTAKPAAPAPKAVASAQPATGEPTESAVEPTADGRAIPESYRLRVSPDRLQFALGLGATEQSEAAVSSALNWLAAQQQADGRWDASDFGAGRETKTLGQDRRGAGTDADSGITGLALLAFLGAGQSHAAGPYRENVQYGLEFLLRNQHADGNLAGYARQFERMYCHGIASVALGEAYALTGDARLLPGLRRAVHYTLSSQDPVSGGWRYQPRDRGDMSQFGWQVMALRSAEAGGMAIPSANRALMLKFLDSSTQGRYQGLASYRPGERVSRTMTAEAMTCRLFLSLPISEGAWREASDYVLQELPGQEEPNLYYWYYATLAMFQRQGDTWRVWNEHLQRHLLQRQHREGPLAGSWDTRDVWGGYGGRIYTTAMAALCLEVYYRYLPLYDAQRSRRHVEAETGTRLR